VVVGQLSLSAQTRQRPLWHETIVVEELDARSAAQVDKALRDLAKRYIELCAPYQLVWGYVLIEQI
jgi:hypothetical protein